jgi:excisionase family DNA binding protein
MTLNEAAAILGVTPDTLRQQIANGKLRARKLGASLWVVTPREVRRYAAENRRAR